jgi:hypothetical protein
VSALHLCSLPTSYEARHPAEPGATVTQLAFSPTENLLAWMDSSGAFTRWPNPIPSSAPDPVKKLLSTAVPGKSGASPLLFDEKAAQDIDTTFGEDADDWMIDDIGIMDDETDARKGQKGDIVKEMGASEKYFGVEDLTVVRNSEHRQGSAGISARVNSHGK